MTTNPSHSLRLPRSAVPPSRPRGKARSSSPPLSRAEKAAARQRTGKRMIVAGSALAVLGVVLYCLASFAGDLGAGMGDVVLRNAVPYARGALAIIGLGTLVWLVGSITYLRGVMDADEWDEGSGLA